MKIGVIAGTGFEDLSSIEGIDLIISRHGREHSISPSNVPYRKNILKMKDNDITHILSITACGSLREELNPGTIVFPNQVIDRTYKRDNFLYDKITHISMGEPFSIDLRIQLEEAAKKANIKYATNKTLVVIEGLRFSTLAESLLYKSWNCDIINMTTMPEATFAKEAGMEYHPIALVTDYDCWKKGEEVTYEKIKETLRLNKEKALELIKVFIALFRRKNG